MLNPLSIQVPYTTKFPRLPLQPLIHKSDMAKRDSFLVRTAPAIINFLKKWTADELRSVNGQIEYVIRDVLRKEAPLPEPKPENDESDG